MGEILLDLGPTTDFARRHETGSITVKRGFTWPRITRFCSPLETSRQLNLVTVTLAKAIASSHTVTLTEEPFEKYRNEMVTCGRIYSKHPDFRRGTFFLEGTIEIDDGNTVKLDLSNLTKFQFFSGQVIVIKGRVINGVFVVDNYWDKAPLRTPPPVVFERPRQLIAISGPYTVEILQNFRRYIEEFRPNSAIFFGPFVPILLTESYDTHFQLLLEDIFEISQNCDVVIVASSREMIHNRTYPSPPYRGVPRKNLQYAPDPCWLNWDGFVIGATSIDVLSHLNDQQVYQKASGSRERRLVTYLLNQKSFYPLYPPDKGVCVDYRGLVEHAIMEERPNLLILPSELPVFAKEVEGCFAVNPGKARGKRGSFARIEVGASDIVSCQILCI